MRQAIIVAVGLVLCSGCGSVLGLNRWSLPNVETPLTEVRRPADAGERWGEYTITEADSTYVYSDQLIEATVIPSGGAFYMNIQNKGDHSLQLIWDQMAYVGPTGVSSSVTSGETRRMDIGRSQTATNIPVGARVEVTAIPNSNLANGRLSFDFVCVDEPYPDVEGQEFSLVLPLRVQNVVNEYTLTFTIGDITPPVEGDYTESCGPETQLEGMMGS